MQGYFFIDPLLVEIILKSILQIQIVHLIIHYILIDMLALQLDFMINLYRYINFYLLNRYDGSNLYYTYFKIYYLITIQLKLIFFIGILYVLIKTILNNYTFLQYQDLSTLMLVFLNQTINTST